MHGLRTLIALNEARASQVAADAAREALYLLGVAGTVEDRLQRLLAVSKDADALWTFVRRIQEVIRRRSRRSR